MRCSAKQSVLVSIKIVAIASMLVYVQANAGAFIFAGNNNGLDIITHPSGYNGSGGQLEIEVCIDSSAVDATDMVVPVKNTLRELNQMTAVSPNLFFGDNNDIPSGKIDFQSLALHELGHCTGLGHPNLGYRQAVITGANTNLTKTTEGANDVFAFNSGMDAIAGSEDDLRDDDENLHWFVRGINNPFVAEPAPESSNYTRDVTELPMGHNFVANAARAAGAALGFVDTEAVMQQGQGTDEGQRSLQADDVVTYRMGMTGLDEVAGTADDYTFNLVFGGIKADTSGCDIVIESKTTGFGSCSVHGVFLPAQNHLAINQASFSYNSDLTFWHFNQTLDCALGVENLSYLNITHSNSQSHTACSSITYGPAYLLAAGGEVTATAPLVTLNPGTTIEGVFTIISTIP